MSTTRDGGRNLSRVCCSPLFSVSVEAAGTYPHRNWGTTILAEILPAINSSPLGLLTPQHFQHLTFNIILKLRFYRNAAQNVRKGICLYLISFP